MKIAYNTYMEKQNDLLMDSSILYRSTQKYYDKMLQDLNLSYAQLPILIEIYENEGISLQKIVQVGGYDKGTVTKNVQKLNTLGYVSILTNAKDKRAKELYTTALTKKHISEIYGIRRDWWHHITQDLNAQQIEVFSKFYQTLSNHARSYADLEQTNLQFYKLKKLSLSDYDSHLSCSLYTGGCNLKCPYCHSKDLVYLKENRYPIVTEKINEYLQGHKKDLDGIYISGGEPLMHEGILSFLQYAKSLGYKIKLHTNGMFYDRLKRILNEKLVDFISLDIKNAPNTYAKTCGVEDVNLKDIEKSLALLKNSLFEYDICVTLVHEFHNEKTMDELGQWIQGVDHVVLQPFVDNETTIDHSLHSPDFDQILKYRQILEQYVKHVEIRRN